MHPNHSSPRRRQKPKTQLRPETLETRSLMTAGAGNTFALFPVTIDEAGGTADVEFTVSQPPFVLPKGKMALGVDVVAQPESSIQPLVSAITDPHDETVGQAIHSIYDPHLPRGAVAAGAGTGAVLTPIVLYPNQPDRPITYTATISAENGTSGEALVGFYLPGDADGNGIVDKTDMNLVRSNFGAVAGDGRYNFSADANRDGRIGRIDIAYTQQNLGVATSVSPFITADLDPASDTGNPDRITDLNLVRLSGSVTPGASLRFEDTSGKISPVETTADAYGHYVIHLPLSPGVNRFRATSTDAFGQEISGEISPITFSPFAQGIAGANKKKA